MNSALFVMNIVLVCLGHNWTKGPTQHLIIVAASRLSDDARDTFPAIAWQAFWWQVSWSRSFPQFPLMLTSESS